MSGAFVVFEGGDGAGKSTQCRLLGEALRARSHKVVLTREPGGTAIGEAIREVLLGPGSRGMAAATEALLFAAARAQHAAELIRPALQRGAVVISDRYLDSSIAYQGAARGLGEEQVAGLSSWATGGLVADLTVVLDVAPTTGLQRAGDANRMEDEPEAFHEAVRACLLRRAAAVPERYLVLPADQPREVIASAVLHAVLALMSPGSQRLGPPGQAGPASQAEQVGPTSQAEQAGPESQAGQAGPASQAEQSRPASQGNHAAPPAGGPGRSRRADP